MKNKLYINIIFLLMSINLFSQNSFKAVYKMLLEKNGYSPTYYSLISKDRDSEFKLIERIIPEKVVSNEYTGEIVLNTETPDSIQPVIRTNFKQEKIYSYDFITEDDGKTYTGYSIVEPITVKWKLGNETKKIDKYLCKKATTRFRGRNYVAWYTEEIPISIGPWKFHGLPGIIINITDNTNQVSFLLEKIEIPYDYLNNKLEVIDSEHAISVREFIEIRKNAKIRSREFFKKKVLSKLPRGANIELTQEGNNDIEIEF
ncbi:GLPGLI family protein [Allomuricauda sp. XS_ASV26]|uniref:GLPGLI family protein n=1 Tax=Allomuricauda sp. XS_ASV26 TaxID=3241292 RepID=UPI0035151FCC